MAVTSNCWIDQGNQNVSGNYTTCVFRGDITASGSSYNNYTKTGSGSFNGVSFTFSTTIPANTTKRMFDITQNIGHNSDGTKTVSASFSLDTGISAGTISGSASRTLTTIPRASSIDSFTTANSYVNSNYTVKFTPKSSSFYNILRISIPKVLALTKRQLGAFSTSQQSVTVTLTGAQLNAIYDKITNKTTVQIGCVIETYSDSGYTNKVGESPELIKTLNLPTNLVPTIDSFSITPINAFGADSLYIKGKSSCTISIDSTTMARGATLSKYAITAAGISYSGTNNKYTTGVLNPNILSSTNNYVDLTFTLKVTDSRGRTGTKTSTIKVYNYERPNIEMTCYRSLNDSTRDDINGTYIYIKPTYSAYNIPGNSIVSKSISIEGVERTSTFSSGTELLYGTYNTNGEFTVSYSATDAVGDTVTITEMIKTAAVPFNINKHKDGIGIGRYSTASHEMQVGWLLKCMGGLSIDNVNIFDLIVPIGTQIYNSRADFDPNVLYPGTVWERKKGVVLGAINEDDTDTNTKTSFNQASGTQIGSKSLYAHTHSLPGFTFKWGPQSTGSGFAYAPTEVYSGNCETGKNYIVVSQGTMGKTNTGGGGDAENIQPTLLSYLWERIS